MPIANNQKHRERQRTAGFIPKPKNIWYGHDSGNPEQMGLHQQQKGRHKAKSKKAR